MTDLIETNPEKSDFKVSILHVGGSICVDEPFEKLSLKTSSVRRERIIRFGNMHSLCGGILMCEKGFMRERIHIF